MTQVNIPELHICIDTPRIYNKILLYNGTKSNLLSIQFFTKAYGYGEAKTLSCLSKYGCVAETQFGFHALELHMFIVAIRVLRAIQEVLQTSLKDSQQR